VHTVIVSNLNGNSSYSYIPVTLLHRLNCFTFTHTTFIHQKPVVIEIIIIHRTTLN